MHMADALLSPAVGAAMWAATAAVVVVSSRRVQNTGDDRRVPLMGVLGAFLFAAQMINFSIPGTGSSGHLGGGLLLSILVGPHAAFLVMASVLIVQALFFADGGLLALGCNIFNLGFFPAFIAYPIYRRLVAGNASPLRTSVAAVLCAVFSLQLGALAVVLETVASGISALPFGTFVAFMLPIHLGIGIVEGLVTAAVVSFVRQARPDILPGSAATGRPLSGLLAGFVVVALLTGGVGAWFASKDPDGLEWSITKVTGSSEPEAPKTGVHALLGHIQHGLAVLPDYGFRPDQKSLEGTAPTRGAAPEAAAGAGDDKDRLGTSVAGVVGGVITLLLAALIGLVLTRLGRRS